MSERISKGKFALGCDVGATKVALTLAHKPGMIKDRVLDSTPRMQGPETLVAEVVSMAEKMLKRNGLSKTDCLGIGVAFAGPVDSRQGLVIHGTNIPGWDNIPLGSMLKDAFGVPVTVQNDATVGALGEYRHGGIAGSGDMLYITVSTGIGAGLIINGAPYQGANSVAGEIGHSTVIEQGPRCGCGKLGCLESVSSGLAIERLAVERMQRVDTTLRSRARENGGKVTPAVVFEEARKGDMLASELVENACRYLGFAIASAVMLMSFSSVVLGGGIAKEGEYLRKRVEYYTRRELARGPNDAVRILVSRMPDTVVDVGALELVFGNMR